MLLVAHTPACECRLTDPLSDPIVCRVMQRVPGDRARRQADQLEDIDVGLAVSKKRTSRERRPAQTAVRCRSWDFVECDGLADHRLFVREDVDGVAARGGRVGMDGVYAIGPGIGSYTLHAFCAGIVGHGIWHGHERYRSRCRHINVGAHALIVASSTLQQPAYPVCAQVYHW